MRRGRGGDLVKLLKEGEMEGDLLSYLAGKHELKAIEQKVLGDRLFKRAD